jgi:D-beta-D-heptose 7-phosphate kinase/D-beta-D-heptose 1-phosphate adenosyltransferase
MVAKVYKEINDDFLKEIDDYRGPADIVATSGGFDPLHIGHVRCIQESSQLPNSILVVIVNGDGFLVRKKGQPFMCHDERMEIVAALDGVDYVVGWDDGGQTVTGALQLILPNYFTKGGDRDSSKNVPEFDLCEEIGCKVLFNVGGGKIQSSSDLIAKSQ